MKINLPGIEEVMPESPLTRPEYGLHAALSTIVRPLKTSLHP